MAELLSPAGNPEKLRAAIRFGADAVYFAGKSFGMRSAADNFTVEEIYEASSYVHERGKKLYLTVNTLPRPDEYPMLERYLCEIADAKLDGFIVADPGVMTCIKRNVKDAEIHISTQAGVVSHESCNFWYSQGVRRVVLAREMSFEDIKRIREQIPQDMEIECFIHGSMCVSFSGRCLLSENLIGRDANRGMCAQPCRWNYKFYEISEEKRPEIRYPVEENELGTFIMSSRDMCMIEHVPELMRSGISSFKIEGRMKSAYYTAVTTNAYRMAIDAYERDPEGYRYDPRLMTELEGVSHREYCTGYYFDRPGNEANLTRLNGYIRDKAYLAVLKHYDKATGIATFIQRNKCSVGDSVELLTPGMFGRGFAIDSMTDNGGEQISCAPHPFMEFKIKLPFEGKEGDILRAAGSEDMQ